MRKTHGLFRTRIWRIHHYMMSRCNTPSDQAYKNYGGRGIRVCERWRDVTLFFEDMGEPPDGCSIDRINNDGNYEPGNCRWATKKEQLNNRRNNRIVEAFGKSQTLHQWAEEYGIKPRTLDNRLFRANMDPEEALNAPLYAKQRGL